MTLASLIYDAVKKTIQSLQLVNFDVAEVVSYNPLKIQLSSGLVLPRESLILTDNVRDMRYKTNKSDITSSSGGANPSHTHTIDLKKEIIIYKRLLIGEKVIVANVTGGQRYIILSRADENIYNDSVIFDIFRADGATHK